MTPSSLVVYHPRLQLTGWYLLPASSMTYTDPSVPGCASISPPVLFLKDRFILIVPLLRVSMVVTVITLRGSPTLVTVRSTGYLASICGLREVGEAVGRAGTGVAVTGPDAG